MKTFEQWLRPTCPRCGGPMKGRGNCRCYRCSPPGPGPPAPLLDPASVRWICGTALALGAMALAGWVVAADPDLARMVARGVGGVFAVIAIFFVLIITR